jgi:hypothetical protein
MKHLLFFMSGGHFIIKSDTIKQQDKAGAGDSRGKEITLLGLNRFPTLLPPSPE